MADFVWGSSPKIYFSITDTVKREGNGTSDKYSGTITVTLGDMVDTHYFGYNIYANVNGGTAQMLKDNSPNQWSAGTYKKSFSVSGSTSASIVTFKVKLYSTTASRSAETFTYNVTIGTKKALSPPSVSDGWFSVTYDNSGTGASGISEWVCGYSRAKVTFDTSKVTVVDEASITKFTVIYDGKETVASDNVAITDTITDTTTTLVMNVTDSNGNSTYQEYSVNTLAYNKPTITDVSIYRSDSLSAADDDGHYITVKGTPGYASLNEKNSVAFEASYKQSGASEFGDELSIESNALTIINETEVSEEKSYVVRLKVTDSLGNSSVYEQIISTKEVSFHIKQGGKGAAFGKYAETENALEVSWDLNVTGDIRAKNISDTVLEFGTSDEDGITWNFRKWSSGIAECWGSWSGTLADYAETNGFYGFYTTVKFPTGLFASTPLMTYSGSVGNSFSLTGTVLSISSSEAKAYALSPISGEQSCKFHIRAVGRWK